MPPKIESEITVCEGLPEVQTSGAVALINTTRTDVNTLLDDISFSAVVKALCAMGHSRFPDSASNSAVAYRVLEHLGLEYSDAFLVKIMTIIDANSGRPVTIPTLN